MSLLRHNPKRDATEPAIIELCEAWGVFVTRLSVSGVPDLLCFAPPHWRHPMFLLEVKRNKSAPLTKQQVTWHENAIRYNPAVAIVWDLDTTMDALTRFRDGE